MQRPPCVTPALMRMTEKIVIAAWVSMYVTRVPPARADAIEGTDLAALNVMGVSFSALSCGGIVPPLAVPVAPPPPAGAGTAPTAAAAKPLLDPNPGAPL